MNNILNEEFFKNYYNEIIGKKIYKIFGLENGSTDVTILFKDTTFLEIGRADTVRQDPCEVVEITDYECDFSYCNDELRDNDIFIIDIQENSNDFHKAKDEDCYVFYTIKTNKGDLWLRFNSFSTDLYSEFADIKYKNIWE